MDSGLIAPVIGVLGVVVGATLGTVGTFAIQRLNNQRTDAGVRRELRTRLRLVVVHIDPLPETLLLSQLRRHLTAAIERAGRPDVGTALNDRQLLAVFDVADKLELLMLLIDDLPPPEDGCYEIDKTRDKSLLELFAHGSTVVKTAVIALGYRRRRIKDHTLYAER
jgi:hypothetical protein